MLAVFDRSMQTCDKSRDEAVWMDPGRSRRAPSWRYFQISSCLRRVMCNFCGDVFQVPNGSTSAMIKHLVNRHRDQEGVSAIVNRVVVKRKTAHVKPEVVSDVT